MMEDTTQADKEETNPMGSHNHSYLHGRKVMLVRGTFCLFGDGLYLL